LKASCTGLQNLKITYEEDKTTLSELECLIERIESVLAMLTTDNNNL